MSAEARNYAELSPLSGQFTKDDITVDVMIYKADLATEGWALEVVLDAQT